MSNHEEYDEYDEDFSEEYSEEDFDNYEDVGNIAAEEPDFVDDNAEYEEEFDDIENIIDSINASSPKNDALVESVIDSWMSEPKMMKRIRGVIEGSNKKGLKTGRILSTTKVAFEYTGADSLYTVPGMLIPDGQIDVPVSWLHKKNLEILYNRKEDGKDVSRVNFWSFNEQGGEYVPCRGLTNKEHKAAYLPKLMILAQNSKTRRTWDSRFMTLNQFPDYFINAYTNGEVLYLEDDLPLKHKYVIKENHANHGFFARSMPDSVMAFNKGKGIVAMESVKKAMARITRLVQHPDAVYLGMRKAFIAKDIPRELTDIFCTGSGLYPRERMEQTGGVRFVSELGCVKAVSLPMPADWEEEVGDCIILSKASFKAGKNGVIEAVSCYTPEEMSKMTLNGHVSDDGIIEGLEYCVESLEETMVLGGHEVTGWFIDFPMYVTSFFALFGLRTPKEDDLDDDTTDPNGDLVCKGSFYNESLDAYRENPNHNLIETIQERLEDESLYYVKQTINTKIAEINQVYWTYGKKEGIKFMKNLVKTSMEYMRDSAKLGVDVMSGVEVPVSTFLKDELRDLAYKIYPGVSIETGLLDPHAWGSEEVGLEKMDMLLNGIEDTDWDGLYGPTNKVFDIEGQQFFIPGGPVMKEYAFPEEGGIRYFMNGPAQALLKLFIAIKSNKTTNWSLKLLNHEMDLQRDLYGKRADGFTVPGFRNKTILPAWWLKNNEIACVDPTYKGQNGEHVFSSKMPVLFDGSVSGFKYLTGIPKKIFGEMTPKFRLALRNMAFVPVDVLLWLGNDTDGDQVTVGFVDGVPMFSDVPEHMTEWSEAKAEDERKLRLTAKEYVYYGPKDIHDGVIESAANKKMVGGASNALATFGHVLQLFVSKGRITFDSARVLRACYSFAVQDFVIDGIKHIGGGDLFADASFHTCLHGKKEQDRLNARGSFDELIAVYRDDMTNVIDVFFDAWDEYACLEGDNKFPPLSRRGRRICDLSLREVSGEIHMKQLDMFTRSYINSSHSAQPVAGMARKDNPAYEWYERAAYFNVMKNVDTYRSKYLLWGQDFENHKDTMIGRLLTYWGKKSGK